MKSTKNQLRAYHIPANYTDSGKLLGGLVKTRNAIEAIIIIAILGVIELRMLDIDTTTKIILSTTTLLPIGLFALIGIRGDSLIQFLGHVFKFLFTRRKIAFKKMGRYAKRKSEPEKQNKSKKEDKYFIQDYIPIANIANGVIQTTDKRYLKIMEIEPINFMLRSAPEQNSIISTFASWLKISPIKIHFKSVVKKADSKKYIQSLQNDLDKSVETFREIADAYIDLIEDIGNKEALTRRFFLIFEYETDQNYRHTTEYSDIIAGLENAYYNAAAYFTQCGNHIVEPDNMNFYLAEIVYLFFNKKSINEEPFVDRYNRITRDAHTEKGLIPGASEAPKIPMAAYVGPKGIDVSHSQYIIMDGLYYCFLYITADGYPSTVSGGWLSGIINAGEGIDVDVFFKKEDRSQVIEKVARKIRNNITKSRSSQDTHSDFDEITNAINSGYYIKSSIANNNEDLFYMNIIITVSADDYESFLRRRQNIINNFKGMDIVCNDFRFEMEQALQSVMPFNKINKDIYLKTRRNILTSDAASTYLFTSFEMCDDNGILLGINRQNNSLCIIDLFNSEVYKNANETILGTSGAGKTFLLQLEALRMRMKNIQCFIIAPLKGYEFKRACDKIGGTYVKISPGSSQCINIMEIRDTVSPDINLLDDVDIDSDSILSKKIQQLSIFFSLLIPDMSHVEEQLLDEALVKAYANKGITHDNNSLFSDINTRKMKKMPIIGDLHELLTKDKNTERLSIILGRFVTGSAQSFNQQTNVDLSNKYVVIDISELKGALLTVGMFIAVDNVWDAVKADRTKKKAVFLDEIWQLIGASSNKHAAEFVVEIFKIIRGYGGAAIAATQDLNDFFALEDGKYGKAIINNSKTKFVLNLEAEEAERVQEVLRLTDSEVDSIVKFKRGEGLIITNNNKVPVKIRASSAEHEVVTTDREQLAAILERKKRNL